MNRNSTFFKRITDFLYDHYMLKQVLEVFKYLFFALTSAAIFAFGFTSFITPHNGGSFVIATGGVSGIAQIIAKVLAIFGVEVGNNVIQGVFYSVLNIPLVIFSFFLIGKKFTIFTTVNVVATSLFVVLFSQDGGIAERFASVSMGSQLMLDSILVRVVLAGICTGVSSAIAFVGNISCGGIDIVTYYWGMRKSSQLGKYTMILNGFVFSIYSLLCVVNSSENTLGYAVFSIIYSALYCIICAAVIDLINLRNKKVRVEIITSQSNMGDILISNFPHGATVENAKGVYSKTDKFIFLMTVSSNEYKKVLSIAQKVDPNSFVSIFSVVQVYGNFYSKPVE
ncbi:MAG: YitT family protein [Bacilli bacterium]|nr:YitT family protein [Bacilli bacterium]